VTSRSGRFASWSRQNDALDLLAKSPRAIFPGRLVAGLVALHKHDPSAQDGYGIPDDAHSTSPDIG
jgi:hypothetical protein